MGPFVSIIQHIIFEKFIWCPSKYHEMKILLLVTSAKIWPESGMLTVNITSAKQKFFWKVAGTGK